MDTKVKMAEEQVQQKRKNFSFKKRGVFLLILLILVLGVGSTVTEQQYTSYNSLYHGDISLAQNGIQHLKTAVADLQMLSKGKIDAQPVAQAQQEFRTAQQIFTKLEGDLKSLPSAAESIPYYGARLKAAIHVLPIATNVTLAGIDGCTLLGTLISRFHDPLNVHNKGLSMTDFATLNTLFNRITLQVKQIIQQVHTLSPEDLQLDPRIGKMVDLLHQNLPLIEEIMNNAQQLMPILPTLIGLEKPTNYLVELLDSTELRPGGGFIGNYGVLTLSGGKLDTVHITDVYLLDKPFEDAGKTIPYPPAYSWFDLAPATWTLRDSNLDADFPTAAQYSEQLYKIEGGTVPLQGVIAITPTLIANALTITGPITIPEYHDTVTSQNLIDRIHYYQLGAGRSGDDIPSPDGHSSVRKRFTELLAEHFITRLHQLAPSTLSKMLLLMLNSLHTKDIQLYFNSNIAEDALHRYQVDSTIRTDNVDGLFVVDANISPSKANQYISNTMDDQVSVNADGSVIHHTTLQYMWSIDGPVYGLPTYRDYVRVYVPPGSILQTQAGWGQQSTGSAFKRTFWAGLFSLNYGEVHTVTLVWKTSNDAIHDTMGWHYHYLIQRQAGANWMLNLKILFPSKANVTKLQGDSLRLINKQEVSLTQSFTKDISINATYTFQ